MQYTENLNLNKPGPSDQYNIQHFNDNFDTLDSHVHALEEAVDSAEIEITEKVDEAKQFPNMEGVCPVKKGGTGANNAQDALVNLHGSVPVVSEIPSTAEVTFVNHVPANPIEGTPEAKTVQSATIGNFSSAVYEKIRGDTGLFSQTKNGLVPKAGAGETVRFLSSDGIWRTPDGASTVYEATTSQSWEVNADTILRIRGNCTSVIGNTSIFGTKLIVLNETQSAQTVALLTAEGSKTLSIPAGNMKQYIWVNYWREQEFGSGGGHWSSTYEEWTTFLNGLTPGSTFVAPATGLLYVHPSVPPAGAVADNVYRSYIAPIENGVTMPSIIWVSQSLTQSGSMTTNVSSGIIKKGHTYKIDTNNTAFCYAAVFLEYVEDLADPDPARDVYSTTEQDTGKTWIDGKKIYRRVFKGETTDYSEIVAGRRLFNIPFSIPDAGEIVSMNPKARLFNATMPAGLELAGHGAFCGQNTTVNIAIVNFITNVTAPTLSIYSPPSLAFTRVTYTCIVEYTKSE